MKLFDWLKPNCAVDTVSPSALAHLLEGGAAVVLEKGQTLVQASKCLEAHRIAESIRKFPGDWAWKMKGYTVVHVPTGFTLWVGNEDWGLREDGAADKSKFSKDEQAIIWPAMRDWIDRFKVGFTGRLPKVRIHGARGIWWCIADGHPWAGAGDSPAHAYRSWARAVSIQERKDANPKERLQVWSAAL